MRRGRHSAAAVLCLLAVGVRLATSELTGGISNLGGVRLQEEFYAQQAKARGNSCDRCYSAIMYEILSRSCFGQAPITKEAFQQEEAEACVCAAWTDYAFPAICLCL